MVSNSRSLGLLCNARLISLCLFSIFWCVIALNAEEPIDDISDVRIFIRTIEATNPVGSDATQGVEPSGLQIDQGLEDLRSKLDQLPFLSFKLIASKEEQLSLRKRETVQLPNGQSLALRPMYMDRKRVGVWLNWKDTGGSDILNTRIHFDADDSVLTGTDCEHDSGLIVAIKAVPVPH